MTIEMHKFSIPYAMFTPYTKDNIHDSLKNNKKLAWEIFIAVHDENAKDSTNPPPNAFNRSLLDQVKERGPDGMSFKQTKCAFRFAHRNAQKAADILNVHLQKTEPVRQRVTVIRKAGKVGNRKQVAVVS